MFAVNCSINFHGIKSLAAGVYKYPDAPLKLTLNSDNPEQVPSEVTMFLDDDILTARLVKAINEICEERRRELQPIKSFTAEEYEAMTAREAEDAVRDRMDDERSAA